MHLMLDGNAPLLSLDSFAIADYSIGVLLRRLLHDDLSLHELEHFIDESVERQQLSIVVEEGKLT